MNKETFYDNGNIRQRITCEKGTSVDEDGFPSQGLRESFHDNGQLWMRGNFKDDKQEGLVEEFSENSQLIFRGHYKDGKPDGLWEKFNDKGQLWFKKIGKKE